MVRSVLIGLTFLLSACGLFSKSEDEVKDEFADWLAKNSACVSDSDCALIMPGCPLGCWAAVRADRKTAAEAKARDLIGDYDGNCIYRCFANPGAACVQKQCALRDADGGVPDSGLGGP